MKLEDFNYELPNELMAQTPIEPRDSSKLLILDKEKKSIEEDIFRNIENKLGENDVLVLNKTKVINARLHGYLDTNRKIEVFLLKELGQNKWECFVYPGKKIKVGKIITFKDSKGNKIDLEAKVLEITYDGRIIKFNKGGIEFMSIIENIGEIPLPPYIKEKLKNKSRYQTVFNEISGSVAAPTAGLHFTNDLLHRLEKKGVKIEKVILHVGAGTFKSVQSQDITHHNMHTEYIELDKKTANRLNDYKKENKRIIAVGTTSIRVLESFTNENGIIQEGKKETNIFIYPGYKWKFVDSIITNFHLPKSTLIMLISSFAGKDFIFNAYKFAIKNKYRFFSFGDAMWIK